MTGVLEVFQKIMDELQKDCAKLGFGIRGKEQILWLLANNQGGQGPKPGKFDFSAIKKLFDRNEAGEKYIKAISSDKTTKLKQDLALLKNQNDVLAGMERDFEMRHRTRIRRLAHESLAKSHAGSDRGVFNALLLAYLQYQMQRVSANDEGSSGA